MFTSCSECRVTNPQTIILGRRGAAIQFPTHIYSHTAAAMRTMHHIIHECIAFSANTFCIELMVFFSHARYKRKDPLKVISLQSSVIEMPDVHSAPDSA